jgi:tetratricopeptide (TPR) repeat protein
MQEDAWFEAGEFPMVVQLLEFHSELEPKDYEIATNLGWMHENIEQWDDAVGVYKKYLVDNPQDPDRALPAAGYYFRKKEYAKVIPLLESTISDRSHPNVFRTLAHSYEKTNQLEKSKQIWDRYIALAPDDGPAIANRKRVEGKIEKAGK